MRFHRLGVLVLLGFVAFGCKKAGTVGGSAGKATVDGKKAPKPEMSPQERKSLFLAGGTDGVVQDSDLTPPATVTVTPAVTSVGVPVLSITSEPPATATAEGTLAVGQTKKIFSPYYDHIICPNVNSDDPNAPEKACMEVQSLPGQQIDIPIEMNKPNPPTDTPATESDGCYIMTTKTCVTEDVANANDLTDQCTESTKEERICTGSLTETAIAAGGSWSRADFEAEESIRQNFMESASSLRSSYLNAYEQCAKSEGTDTVAQYYKSLAISNDVQIMEYLYSAQISIMNACAGSDPKAKEGLNCNADGTQNISLPEEGLGLAGGSSRSVFAPAKARRSPTPRTHGHPQIHALERQGASRNLLGDSAPKTPALERQGASRNLLGDRAPTQKRTWKEFVGQNRGKFHAALGVVGIPAVGVGGWFLGSYIGGLIDDKINQPKVDAYNHCRDSMNDAAVGPAATTAMYWAQEQIKARVMLGLVQPNELGQTQMPKWDLGANKTRGRVDWLRGVPEGIDKTPAQQGQSDADITR